MKRNFAKIRDTLGKLVLATATLLWVSCDDSGSNAPIETSAKSSSSAGVEPTSFETSSESLATSSEPAQVSSSSKIAPNSSATPLPVSSESFVPNSYLISVDEFLSNYVTDTTGLRGKCITKENYCKAVAYEWGYRVTEMNARGVYSDKLDTLLNHDDNQMNLAKKNCLSELVKRLRIPENPPLYGASPCGGISGTSGDYFPEYKGQDCELDESAENRWNDTVGAIVDEAYIKQLAAHNDDVRERAIEEFGRIEASMDSCDRLE